MNNIIKVDYANKTEFVLTFSVDTLKTLSADRQFGDEWDFIDRICDDLSFLVSRPLLQEGFIVKERMSLTHVNEQINKLILFIQMVAGLPELDIDLIKQSLAAGNMSSGLESITYRDQFNQQVTL